MKIDFTQEDLDKIKREIGGLGDAKDEFTELADALHGCITKLNPSYSDAMNALCAVMAWVIDRAHDGDPKRRSADTQRVAGVIERAFKYADEQIKKQNQE